MALVALFAYLNRYTLKRFFTIWTVAWLYYALWLLLHLVWPALDASAAIQIARQCSLGMAGVFLLWGSAEFLEQHAPQRMMALFLVFVLVWSALGIFHEDDPMFWQTPVFGLLGLASIISAGSFVRFRRRYQYVGAGLLAVGFLLWGGILMALPRLLNEPEALSGAFVILNVLQLFLAASMIVLVLEEVRADVIATRQRIEEKKTESEILNARIRSTEERYKMLFEQAGEAIVIAGDDLHIIEINASARALLGLDVLPPGGASLASFLRLPADAPRGGPFSAWLEFFARHPQMELARRDGSAASVEIQSAPAQFEQRTALQIVLREVTEKVRLELQMRQTEKLSALGQMISGVAHELNNPLTAIQGFTQLILSRHDLPAQTRKDLEKVSTESQRAARLVSQFLAFARAEAPRHEVANLNELIRQAVALREFEFRVADVSLRFDLADDLPRTLVDPDKFQHAILNLVGNALHAVCDQPAPRQIVVQTRGDASEIRVSVTDNGPGVPPEMVSRIFEPFFTTKEVGTGTGLGLSVVHSIMADHRGRAFYEAPPEGGARFVLVFPVASCAAETPAPAPALAAAPSDESLLRGARVLVLDDEQTIADLLREMLHLLGCQIRVASSGPQALEHIREQPFDVILSDFRMPNMNGQQFHEQVRLLKPDLAKRIIFLTGDVVNEQTQAFLQASGNPYLAKPFNLTALQAVMTALLREKSV